MFICSVKKSICVLNQHFFFFRLFGCLTGIFFFSFFYQQLFVLRFNFRLISEPLLSAFCWLKDRQWLSLDAWGCNFSSDVFWGFFFLRSRESRIFALSQGWAKLPSLTWSFAYMISSYHFFIISNYLGFYGLLCVCSDDMKQIFRSSEC